MRLVLGIIIGIALTIGAAYVHDRSIPASPIVVDASRGRIVNWNVMNAVVDEQVAVVRGWWNSAFGK